MFLVLVLSGFLIYVCTRYISTVYMKRTLWSSLEFCLCYSLLLGILSCKLELPWSSLSLIPLSSAGSTPVSSLVAQTVKNLSAKQETWFDPWVGKTSWRREWLPIPVFLPGEFHRQRSLVGYSPQSCKESDTIEQLKLSLFFPTQWSGNGIKAVLEQS